VLSFSGNQEGCQSWIAVQNVGDEPGKAVLLVWGDGSDCAPRCSGAASVTCSGLIGPGSSWIFAAADLPPDAKSGIVYSFNARRLSEIGIKRRLDETVADAMCRALYKFVLGSCDEYRLFRRVHDIGATYDGIPLGRAYGPALVGEVHRVCPGSVNKIASVSASYAGVAGDHFGGLDRVFGVSSYHATFVHGDRSGAHSVIYVQNGGANCASVTLWLESPDRCRQSRLCDAFTIAQGATVAVDVADCADPGWEGSVRFDSSEPLAVAVDTIGPDSLATYTAFPSELRYGFDHPPQFTMGGTVVHGPVVGHSEGWAGRVHVQNLSSTASARVSVMLLDASGSPIAPESLAWLCSRGSRSFVLPSADAWAGQPGSVRVESLAGRDEKGRSVSPPNISALAELRADSDPHGRNGHEVIVYDLPHAERAAPWPPGRTATGSGLLAVPVVNGKAGPGGVRSEIAVANVVRQPGFTNVMAFLYDRNGRVAASCRRLHELEVARLGFGEWGYVDPSFVGSAVISAAAWSHPLLDGAGEVVANPVGLAAVIARVGVAPAGSDTGVGGDGVGATSGLPIERPGPRLLRELRLAAEETGCQTLPEVPRRPTIYVPLARQGI
jgi:hypothetical protein